MIELVSGREIDVRYNMELAAQLLGLAEAEDKVSSEEFAGQLWTWACAMADLLENRQDRDINPTLAKVRKELRKISIGLIHLSVEARVRLAEQLGSDPASTNGATAAEEGHATASNILEVDRLLFAAIQAADNCYDPKIKDGPKNRLQDVRRVATKELGLAWQVLTGKRPTRRVHGPDHGDTGMSYGKFQEFAIAAQEPLFGATEAASGIDAIIKYVIVDMAKTDQQSRSRFFHI